MRSKTISKVKARLSGILFTITVGIRRFVSAKLSMWPKVTWFYQNYHFYSGKTHVGQIKFDQYGFEVAIKSTSDMIIRCFSFRNHMFIVMFYYFSSNEIQCLCLLRIFSILFTGDKFMKIVITVPISSFQIDKHMQFAYRLSQRIMTNRVNWRLR